MERRDRPPPIDGVILQPMMRVAVGESVSDDYAAMMREESALLGSDPKGFPWLGESPQERLAAFPMLS